MKRRPRELTILAIVFLGNALFLSIKAIPTFSNPWTESALIHYGIVGLSWALIPLTLRASRALWGIVLFSAGCIALRGWGASPLFLSVPACLIIAMLCSSSCRKALFYPSRRWWLTPQRKHVSLKTKLRPVLGGELLVKTFDISETGLFIALEQGFQWHKPQARSKQTPDSCLEVGAYCWLRITLNEFSALSCTAEIVRKTTKAQGSYPAGIGLRFVGLSAQDKKLLSQFLKSLNEQQQPIEQRPAAQAPATVAQSSEEEQIEQIAA